MRRTSVNIMVTDKKVRKDKGAIYWLIKTKY